jgi:hypothetical protein
VPSKKDTELLTNLRAASTKLTEVSAPELAATIDGLLAPGGWGRLRSATEADNTAQNVPVRMPLVLRSAIQDAAKTAGDSLPAVVAEGLQEFIAGTFRPAANAHRVRRNSGLEMATLNVRIDAELKDRFRETAETLAHNPAINHIVKAWLIEKYDIAPAEKLAEA